MNIGFGELLVVILIALLVLGPERMPKAARSAGRYWQRIQQLLTTARTEFNRVVDVDDLSPAPTKPPQPPKQISDQNDE